MNKICRCIVPEMCLNCRNLISTQVMRIRRALKENPLVTVEFSVFNKKEVDEIKKALKPEELKRVFFKWLVFKEYHKNGENDVNVA